MALEVFNKLRKLSAPPFVTVALREEAKRRNAFKTWSKLQLCDIAQKISTFSLEGDLLKAFLLRKGTQLRLEKALMLTRRIHTIFCRWKSNGFWEDLSKFNNAFESNNALLIPSPSNKKKGKLKKQFRVKGNTKEVHLPSRQWANWVIYLILRDLLLLSKIKYECERTVGYWLGLISCSHHPGDSLIIVGILSRLWAVSGGVVENYANQVYPGLLFISSLLNATRADNWLEDIDFPNELFTWLEKILGFSFQPASIGGFEQILRRDESKNKNRSSSSSTSSSKMDTILSGVFYEEEDELVKKPESTADVPSTSSRIRDLSKEYGDDEEDLGVPVQPNIQHEQHAKVKVKVPRNTEKTSAALASRQRATTTKLALNKRWTKFFENFKSKLKSEQGRKQIITRIKKYMSSESNQEISARLIKLRKFVKGNKEDKLHTFIPKFKRFLSKKN